MLSIVLVIRYCHHYVNILIIITVIMNSNQYHQITLVPASAYCHHLLSNHILITISVCTLPLNQKALVLFENTYHCHTTSYVRLSLLTFRSTENTPYSPRKTLIASETNTLITKAHTK